MDKKLKQLEEEQKQLLRQIQSGKSYTPKKQKNELLQFFIGLLLLGGGLFWIFQSVRVSTTWGSFFRFGIPNGAIIIPLLIGIVMLFLMDKKIFGWIVTAIGILVILITIIMSVRLYFVSTSLYEYVLMFGAVAVGSGLVLKALFKK